MDTIRSSQLLLPKVFRVLFLSLLVSLVGFLIGQVVPPVLAMPLYIVEIGLLIALLFLRKKKSIGYTLMYSFMFVSGLTMYFVIVSYISMLGASLVLQGLGVAILAFGGTALYAIKSKQDFSFLGGFLFASTIVLVLMTLVGLFLPFSGTTELMVSGFGILIFIGWTLFDFSRLTRQGFSDDDIPMIVVSIYLDFVNLFLFILRFLGASRD
ncbi:Bax inhibitor-1/YccA family protein [Paenibacillus algorifonticola]|uniref:Bax inhibitor-1/YccA family protein n=1 Tax=Paenibacillus algorifonticola TaxID=684063 RepID=UPI003D26EE46